MKKVNPVYPVIIPMLIALAILTTMRAGFTLYDISVHKRLLEHQQVSAGERSFFNAQLQVRAWLFTILGIVYVVLLCIWIYQEYKQVYRINNGNTKYKPLLGALSPVIPLFNLFAPIMVLAEIWDTYCKDIADHAKGLRLVKQWFFLFVVSMIFARILTTINSGKGEHTDLLYYNLLLYLVQMHYFTTTIKLIKKITEARKNYELYIDFLVQENNAPEQV